MANNTITPMIVGQTSSQKTASASLDTRVLTLNIASQLLQRTLFGRPALKNRTAKRPPAKNASRLNELRSSTADL